jgi:hypothetical protein
MAASEAVARSQAVELSSMHGGYLVNLYRLQDGEYFHRFDGDYQRSVEGHAIRFIAAYRCGREV